MDTHEFSNILAALEQRYAETDSAIEQLKLTPLMMFYYEKIKRLPKPTIEITYQSKMNTPCTQQRTTNNTQK